jgi:hypothetical protein
LLGVPGALNILPGTPDALINLSSSLIAQCNLRGQSPSLNLPLHLNTSLEFTASTKIETELSAIELYPDGIWRALIDYFNQSFINTLCDITTFGTYISYEGMKTCVCHTNHGTAYSNAQVVTEAL